MANDLRVGGKLKVLLDEGVVLFLGFFFVNDMANVIIVDVAGASECVGDVVCNLFEGWREVGDSHFSRYSDVDNVLAVFLEVFVIQVVPLAFCEIKQIVDGVECVGKTTLLAESKAVLDFIFHGNLSLIKRISSSCSFLRRSAQNLQLPLCAMP